jgi:hypothetical protein
MLSVPRINPPRTFTLATTAEPGRRLPTNRSRRPQGGHWPNEPPARLDPGS